MEPPSRDAEPAPQDAEKGPLVLSPRGAADASGVLRFRCTCGATLKSKAADVGREGKCPRCRQRVLLTGLHPRNAPPDTPVNGKPKEPARSQGNANGSTKAKQVVKEICAIDRRKIDAGEATITCTGEGACGNRYHRECWEENFGCATYGCPNVHVLKPKTVITGEDTIGESGNTSFEAAAPEPGLPWEFALLALSVLAALVSMAMWGLPSLTVAGLGALFVTTSRRPRMPIMMLVWLVSALGLVIGLAVSQLIYQK